MIQNNTAICPARRTLNRNIFNIMTRLVLVSTLFLMPLLYIPSSHAGTSSEEKYFAAEKHLARLMNSKAKQKYRENWLKCIEKFHDVYKSDPNGPWAPAGLYKAGTLYLDLYSISWLKSDEEKSIDLLEKIVKDYPKSRYHLEAAKKLNGRTRTETVASSGSKKPKTIKPKIIKIPLAPLPSQSAAPDDIEAIISDQNANDAENDMGDSVDNVPSAAGKQSVVTALRYWSNPSYTRVVVDTDGEPNYSHHMLRKDPSINKPQRLFIDFANSRIDPSLNRQIPINDNLLKNVRAGQYTPESARVVIDIKSYDNYKVFTLRNPFRIVIDVWGKKSINGKRNNATPPPVGNQPPPPHLPAGSLAQQLALGVKTIVIDPGHGGKDYGARGYLKGVHEKHITLALGLKLAKKIRETLNCEVIMTRTDDRYITLEERTAIANTQNADLFISIHTNAHRNANAYGIETYFLNLATDEAAISVAARENATSTKNISDLQSILDSLMQNSKINESSRLAGFVQQTMTSKMKQDYSKINNKGVKQAPFYVLLGAQMPAILIETSFISNPRECKRLTDVKYQESLCDAIINGIKQYIKTTNPTALYNPDTLKSRS
ncbi:MAG: N-acetylmuramoyl-L-alanine amidase [Proteobacteria bacterium]|nr:N-acetylmuramoyl-L-alanine amidase [Pseudomonadota bacterium]